MHPVLCDVCCTKSLVFSFCYTSYRAQSSKLKSIIIIIVLPSIYLVGVGRDLCLRQFTNASVELPNILWNNRIELSHWWFRVQCYLNCLVFTSILKVIDFAFKENNWEWSSFGKCWADWPQSTFSNFQSFLVRMYSLKSTEVIGHVKMTCLDYNITLPCFRKWVTLNVQCILLLFIALGFLSPLNMSLKYEKYWHQPQFEFFLAEGEHISHTTRHQELLVVVVVLWPLVVVLWPLLTSAEEVV